MVVNRVKKGSGDEGGEAHYLKTFLRFAPLCPTRGLGKKRPRYALGYFHGFYHNETIPQN
jgi:hypothetical protein